MDLSHTTVFVVDDEQSVRSAISSLCEDAGHTARACASPEAFLQEDRPNTPSCLVLDVRFPGASPNGLELQRALLDVDAWIPTIFISGHADIRIAVEAMKRGAVDFFEKPFREQELLDAIRRGLEEDLASIERLDYKAKIQSRVASLTERERDIMLLMARGLIAKQIAGELRISEVTAKIHRAKMLKKLDVRTPIDVARLVDSLTEDSSRASKSKAPIKLALPAAADGVNEAVKIVNAGIGLSTTLHIGATARPLWMPRRETPTR